MHPDRSANDSTDGRRRSERAHGKCVARRRHCKQTRKTWIFQEVVAPGHVVSRRKYRRDSYATHVTADVATRHCRKWFVVRQVCHYGISTDANNYLISFSELLCRSIAWPLENGHVVVGLSKTSYLCCCVTFSSLIPVCVAILLKKSVGRPRRDYKCIF